MKKYLAALAVMGALIGPACAADSYSTNPESSVPAFDIPKLGFLSLHGIFKKTSGKVMIDFVDKTGSVDFTVYTESLDVGWDAWNKHLSDEGLFNVKKYPTMNFRSDKLIFDANKIVAAEGQFTMLGVTKPLRIVVNDFQCSSNPVNKKQACSGTVAATIKRSDFGLTQYVPVVSDEVKISVPVEADKD